MPAFFISHGAPTLAIEQNEYTNYLRSISSTIPKPKAIIVFSAHWESDVLTVSYTNEQYKTIYDFGGFAEELYKMVYPAKGSTEIADKMIKLFQEAQIPVQKDERRGLDHGAWVILHHLYPNADIRVINVSVNPNLEPRMQYKIGQALKSLRTEDVLIIGSGGISHNLRQLNWQAVEPFDWTIAFDDWVIDKVTSWDFEALFQYREQAPFAQRSVPRNEHFDPLFMVMGSASDKQQAVVTHRSYQFGSLSMITIQFN